jgi:hypothetical protein
MNESMNDAKLRELIDREVQEGESVLWSGRPKPVWFTKFNWAILQFGILWTAFTVFWLTVKISKAPDSFGWAGAGLLLIGMGLLSSPYWNRRRLARTAYVITNRRAIIVERKRGGAKVKSVLRERLGNSFRREYPDGISDVIVDREIEDTSDGKFVQEITFMRIGDGRAIEKLLNAVAVGDVENTLSEKVKKRSANVNTRLDSYIPPNLQRMIFAEVETDEAIVWSQMPQPIFFTRSVRMWYWIGIPIVLCAMIGATWFSHALGLFRDEANYSSLVFLELIFVALLLMILSKPIEAHRDARRIAYVITDRRAISFEVKGSVTIRSYNGDKLARRYSHRHGDGTSDIILNVPAWRDQQAEPFEPELGLFRIQDADRVETLLNDLAMRDRKTIQLVDTGLCEFYDG